MTWSRRDLFRAGVVAGGAVVVPACKSEHESAPAAAATFGPVPAPELEEQSLGELAAKLASGAETSLSLVAKFRKRIEAVNAAGPMLRAILEVNPEADAIANRLDAERRLNKVRGPLHGIPIVVKDNIDTGDKMTTTAGSLALEGSFASKDAFAVAKLREAGALVFAKANLSEWANFRGAVSTSGWSARGGQCRNPYALDRSPSGSSSGSAVAVAMSLCGAALGSETDGSIVSPASCNGLVGVKPTIGLVSRSGLIPVAMSQDTIGPLARTVRDAAIVLTAIAAADPMDSSTNDPKRPAAPIDYTAGLDPKALVGARIGVPRAGFFGNNRNVDGVIAVALQELVKLGAVLVDPAELKVPPELGPAELDVFLTELKVSLNAYLATRPDARIRTLADLIMFNVQHGDREMRFFGQESLEASDKKLGGLEDPAYLAARAKCVAITRDQLLDKVMADLELDAFVAATSGPAWLIDPIDGDASVPSCTTLPAVAGYPHVTVPAGQYVGLPIGLSFFGAPYSEAKLLGYAYAFEQATKHRRAPKLLPTAAFAAA